MTLKYITGHQDAIKNLYEDVGTNAVVCYDVQNFPASKLASFYPPAYLAKCTSVTVITSGDSTQNKTWLGICPFRVDESGNAGEKVYDIDPFIVALDSNTLVPSETGIIAYHQSFEDRTSRVTGYEHLTKEATVSALRQQIVTGASPLSAAPAPVVNSLHHMVKLFQQELL